MRKSNGNPYRGRLDVAEEAFDRAHAEVYRHSRLGRGGVYRTVPGHENALRRALRARTKAYNVAERLFAQYDRWQAPARRRAKLAGRASGVARRVAAIARGGQPMWTAKSVRPSLQRLAKAVGG
jgi:hypothetical protein